MFEKKFILGVGIADATKNKVLEYIIKTIETDTRKYFIVTSDPEILVLANKAKEYKKILNNAELALPDGIGIILAGKVLGKTLRERVTGVDLLEGLCNRVAKKPITVGFLGGGERVAVKAAECLRLKYPGLRVGFVGEEWPWGSFDNSGGKVDGRRLKIEDSNLKMEDGRSLYPLPSNLKNPPSTFYHLPSKNIDILFVAFGAPKQEMWISENLDKIPVRVAIGVGGAFDYISGNVKRAPSWVQKIGFEWLFRLIIQPWRIKRQMALLEFAFLVVREKIGI